MLAHCRLIMQQSSQPLTLMVSLSDLDSKLEKETKTLSDLELSTCME